SHDSASFPSHFLALPSLLGVVVANCSDRGPVDVQRVDHDRWRVVFDRSSAEFLGETRDLEHLAHQRVRERAPRTRGRAVSGELFHVTGHRLRRGALGARRAATKLMRDAVAVTLPRLAKASKRTRIARERALCGALLWTEPDQSSVAVEVSPRLCSTNRERTAAHASRDEGSCGHESRVPRGKKLRATITDPISDRSSSDNPVPSDALASRHAPS